MLVKFEFQRIWQNQENAPIICGLVLDSEEAASFEFGAMHERVNLVDLVGTEIFEFHKNR